jgi:VanZ family protein
VSRWATILTFGVGFIFAFGGTAVFSYLGQNPAWMWGLFVLVGLWFWQLPNLSNLDVKITLLCFYAFPFLTLWLASDVVPPGDIKTFVFQMLMGALLIASAVSVGFVISFYSKKGNMRPIIGGLSALFVCAWLVAYFSSSTGASSRMLDFAMHRLHMSRDLAWALIGILRKSLHFIFYGTIGALALRAVRRGGVSSKAVILALAFVLMHASFDEIRQSSYSSRSGSFWDVCLDMAGACCFVLGANAIKRKPVTRKAETQPLA